MRRPELRVKHILKWADNFRESFKRWPKRSDGRITGSLGETWLAIDMALRKRGRGLVVRSSLAQLLEEYRGVRNRSKLPRLTFKRILEWADDHFAKYKTWPTINSGKVMHAPEESWSAIDKALKGMWRGLSPSSSLAKLLSVHRKVRRSHHLPNLNLNQILQWSDAYYKRRGKWPTRNSGEVPELAGESWIRIDSALVQGHRGLDKGSSLGKLLASYDRHRNRKALPKLNTESILRWADQFIVVHHRWPTHLSGSVPGSGGETWSAIHSALYQGGRGFPGGDSLFQLLKRNRNH